MRTMGRAPQTCRHWMAGMFVSVILLVACGGSGASTAPSSPIPAAIRTTDNVDTVFLRLLLVYQSQGLDAARQFARDQALMTPTEDVRVTLVLDSSDSAVVDGTAVAVGRLGGRVTATFGNQIELVMPVRMMLEYGTTANANKQSFFADLADVSHIRDIRRTPLAQPAIVRLP